MMEHLRVGDLCSLSARADGRNKEIYKIRGFVGEGSSMACYDAAREREGRIETGKLKRCVNVERAEEILGKYRLLSEIIDRDESNEVLKNFIEQGEVLYGDDTVWFWAPSVKGEGFDEYLNHCRIGFDAQDGRKAGAQLYDILSTLITLADCTNALHRAGIVHMDLKPSNFLVSYTSEHKINPSFISLFDIDSIYEIGSRTNAFMGTRGFCAPEVKRGKADNRSDIYSLGAILFYAIVYYPEIADGLYRDEFYKNIDQMVKHSGLLEASDASMDVQLVATLARILKMCLAKNPKNRYDSCLALLEDLKIAKIRAEQYAVDEAVLGQNKKLVIVNKNEGGINSPAIVLQKMLYVHPLYEALELLGANAFDTTGESSLVDKSVDLNVLVLGSGDYGQKFIDLCLQAAQMKNVRLTITASSNVPEEDYQTYIQFRPEIRKFVNFNNDAVVPEDIAYGRVRFVRELKVGYQPNYVFVALGDDKLNARVAEDWANYLGKWNSGGESAKKRVPVCYVTGDILADEKSYPYPVCINIPITPETMVPALERMAFNTHLSWMGGDGGEDALAAFRWDKYAYEASIAYALSIQYKLWSLGIDKGSCDWEKVPFDELAYLEHRRWVLSLVTDGWRAPVDAQGRIKVDECARTGKTRDVVNRTHPCIVYSSPATPLSGPEYMENNRAKWDDPNIDYSLDELDLVSIWMHQAVTRLGGDDSKRYVDYKKFDRILVEKIPFILMNGMDSLDDEEKTGPEDEKMKMCDGGKVSFLNKHYDAFISYSHEMPDGAVAEKLHHMIEHYRIPRRIQKECGKRRFERVFRDREELPLSSDLGETIEAALENSDYLILIASPRAKASVWVNREIEYFLKYHGKDRVLTVLVDGEPEEVFPEILTMQETVVTDADGNEHTEMARVEPMAADVRGKNKAACFKRLKGEFLRIVAPMLNCTYDDLKQRNKEYVHRRMMGILGAILGVTVLGAGSFSWYSYQKAVEYRALLRESQMFESSYLAELSAQKLEAGDRYGAVEAALTALPKDDEDNRPLMPEAVYALNNALYTYSNYHSLNYEADKIIKTSYPIIMADGTLDGEYYCVLDEAGDLSFYRFDDKTLEYTIYAEDLEPEDEKIIGFGFDEKDGLVFITRKNIYRWDIEERKSKKVTEIAGAVLENANTVSPFDMKSGRIALPDTLGFWIYDMESGEEIFHLEGSYKSENPLNHTMIKDISLNGDGTKAVIALEKNSFYTDDEKTAPGLLVVDLPSGEYQFYPGEEDVVKVEFLNEKYKNQIAVVTHTQPSDFMDNEKTNHVSVFDLEKGEYLWQSQGVYTSIGAYVVEVKAMEMEDSSGLKEDILASSINEHLLLLRVSDGQELARVNYSSLIMGMQRYDSRRILVATYDGKMYSQQPESMDYLRVCGSINQTPNGLSLGHENSSCAQCTDSAVIFRSFMIDDSMTSVEESGQEKIKTQETTFAVTDSKTGEKNYWRTAKGETYNMPDGQKGKKLYFWKKKLLEDGTYSEEKRYEVEITDPEREPFCWGTSIFSENGIDYISYSVTEQIPNERYSSRMVHTLKIEGGDVSEVYQWEPIVEQVFEYSGSKIYYNPEFCFAKDNSWAVVRDGNSWGIFDLRDGSWVKPFEEDAVICYAYENSVIISPDSGYVLLYDETEENEEENAEDKVEGATGEKKSFFRIWDVGAGAYLDHIVPLSYDQRYNAKTMVNFAEKKDAEASDGAAYMIAVLSDNRTITISDLGTGECIQEIPYYSSKKADLEFAFFHDNQYLLVNDWESIKLWSLERAAYVDSIDSQSPSGFAFDIDPLGRYFAVRETWVGYGYNYAYQQQLYVYTFDEKTENMNHFADVKGGRIDFVTDCIEVQGLDGKLYRSPFIDYKELRDRAERLLGLENEMPESLE